jgi:hypothetical protein
MDNRCSSEKYSYTGIAEGIAGEYIQLIGSLLIRTKNIESIKPVLIASGF